MAAQRDIFWVTGQKDIIMHTVKRFIAFGFHFRQNAGISKTMIV